MHLIYSFLIAFSTYSSLPMPQAPWSEENRRYVMCFFPLVGLVIGVLVGGWLYVCEAFSCGPFLKGAVCAVLPLLVSGGIHMDGFMDTTDALSSWQPKEKRLEILKDSHVGAFAVMGCAAYLLLEAAIFSEAEHKDVPGICAIFVASRAMSAFTMTLFRKARPEGMLNQFACVAAGRILRGISVLYMVLCISVWLLSGVHTALLCIIAIAIVTIFYHHMANQRFGGITGDLAGWYLQMMELALAAVIVVGKYTSGT